MTTQKQDSIKQLRKMTIFHIFMTKKDEEDFSRLINQSMPSVKFLDIYAWENSKAVIKKSINECCTVPNSNCALIDTNITSIQDYEKDFVTKPAEAREQYKGSSFAKGMIRLIHSQKVEYSPACMRNGSLTALYYPLDDSETDFFVKSIWKLFRKHAAKLYDIDPKTGVISDKPITNFWAWPDAIAKYDRVDGNFLTNHAMAYFTSYKD